MSLSNHSSTTGVKQILGAYIVTMGVILFGIMFVMFFLVDTFNCSAMERALATLWTIIAIVLLISTILVSTIAFKLIPNRIGCLAAVAAFLAATLVCSGFLSFGMMVAFNC